MKSANEPGKDLHVILFHSFLLWHNFHAGALCSVLIVCSAIPRFRLCRYELIKHFRDHNGEGQWKRKELNLLARAQAELGGHSFWEDVHEDGNSDSKYSGPAWANGGS